MSDADNPNNPPESPEPGDTPPDPEIDATPLDPRLDLTDLLHDWPMESGRINARMIAGRDGQRKVQVRIDLGVLQMNSTDRPDGRRPNGAPTLLAWHQQQQKRYERDTGMSAGFVLSPDECRALREEAVQFYHRYVAMFSLKEFEAVVRDTTHNLGIFDLCGTFGPTDQDRLLLEQFRPSVIMTRARAEAESAILRSEPRAALAALDRGLGELRVVFDDAGQGDSFDQANEVQLLRGMRDALIPKLPASQSAELEERLRAAIDAENYELAAILRDELRMMKD